MGVGEGNRCVNEELGVRHAACGEYAGHEVVPFRAILPIAIFNL